MSTRSSGEEPFRFRLPRGATGFGGSGPVPETDRRVFSAMCHQAARAVGGSVGLITRPGVTPNFHSAVISWDGNQVRLLGHQYVPLLATAMPCPDPGTTLITFVEDPVIRAALDLSPWPACRLLTLEELRTPLSLADCSALDRAEREQARYWNPATAGELIFNYWD